MKKVLSFLILILSFFGYSQHNHAFQTSQGFANDAFMRTLSSNSSQTTELKLKQTEIFLSILKQKLEKEEVKLENIQNNGNKNASKYKRQTDKSTKRIDKIKSYISSGNEEANAYKNQIVEEKRALEQAKKAKQKEKEEKQKKKEERSKKKQRSSEQAID